MVLRNSTPSSPTFGQSNAHINVNTVGSGGGGVGVAGGRFDRVSLLRGRGI